MNRDGLRDRIEEKILSAFKHYGAVIHEKTLTRATGAVVAEVWPEVERLQALTAECSCGGSYETYGGPEPDCAVHGAVRALNQAEALLDQARMDCQAYVDEAERLRGEKDAAEAKVAEWERVHAEHNEIHDIGETAALAWRQRTHQAEAKQQAVADPIARARQTPGQTYVPIELLEIAAADQPAEAVTGLHAAIREVLVSFQFVDDSVLTDLAAAYESATGWTAEERT